LDSYARRFFAGWIASYIVVLVIVAVSDSDDFAYDAGRALARTLLGALAALGIDRLTNRRMPLLAYLAICLAASLVFGAIAVAGERS
jgi:hypothetical protein